MQPGGNMQEITRALEERKRLMSTLGNAAFKYIALDCDALLRFGSS